MENAEWNELLKNEEIDEREDEPLERYPSIIRKDLKRSSRRGQRDTSNSSWSGFDNKKQIDQQPASISLDKYSTSFQPANRRRHNREDEDEEDILQFETDLQVEDIEEQLVVGDYAQLDHHYGEGESKANYTPYNSKNPFARHDIELLNPTNIVSTEFVFMTSTQDDSDEEEEEDELPAVTRPAPPIPKRIPIGIPQSASPTIDCKPTFSSYYGDGIIDDEMTSIEREYLRKASENQSFTDESSLGYSRNDYSNADGINGIYRTLIDECPSFNAFKYNQENQVSRSLNLIFILILILILIFLNKTVSLNQ